MSELIIYQNDDGSIALPIKVEAESIWLTQVQLAELFDKDVRTINEHIKNIYKTAELDEDSTFRKFRIVRQEGKR
ncbi:hypothetical protein C2869_14205 [Saccharobesus litoralis]|uniref:Virulence protein RhuM family protein n=1 Tax=Saccharobesus litoralis TaxID=2172099 RepID=A0A2S0VTL6_9ALTE|nr:hypothetical protein [Saccharobesus litoralis]AWB67522.1 hypothetical protein C2869_14205 [Saccharobesus litoralis]